MLESSLGASLFFENFNVVKNYTKEQTDSRFSHTLQVRWIGKSMSAREDGTALILETKVESDY